MFAIADLFEVHLSIIQETAQKKPVWNKTEPTNIHDARSPRSTRPPELSQMSVVNGKLMVKLEPTSHDRGWLETKYDFSSKEIRRNEGRF